MPVSIHAPVWGATLSGSHTRRPDLVSIHAPVWGATFVLSAEFRYCAVSIHAPVWGATHRPGLEGINRQFQSTRPYGARRGCSITARQATSFNPRARMGRDFTTRHIARRFRRFNPRARMGRDPAGREERRVLRCFNPRARMGRDARISRSSCSSGVSIHAPVWGATRCAVQGRGAVDVSIHAPVWGAT